MEEYRFEHKEPLTQRVVLALRVNTKQLKEHLWLGTEYEVGTALRSLDKPLYLAQTRPLGAFWCEFGKSSAEGWTEAVWALCEALSARKTVERDEQEQKAAELLSRLTVGNAAALYAAIQIWEMYLRCCRGRDKHKAEAALRDYAQLLILPFGEYSPEMANWKWGKTVVPVWNAREDAKLEIWYPHGEVPFECAVVSGSLRPALIYYRQRILDAGMVMRTCNQCGRVFFAPDARSNLCSERCLTGALGESAKCAKTIPKGSWPAQKTDSERGVIYGTIYELDDWARGYYSGNLRRVRGTDYPHG